MKRFITTIICLVLTATFAFSQDTERKAIVTPTVHLDGPRVGLTYLGKGELRQRLMEEGINPIISQFGWQFEKQYFSLNSGMAGLVEAVVLVGGLEQNTFLPSASFLVGLRNAKGFEFGFGPNLSLAGASLVISGGFTIQSGELNFPVNLALVPSSDGLRVSLLVGFNARKH